MLNKVDSLIKLQAVLSNKDNVLLISEDALVSLNCILLWCIFRMAVLSLFNVWQIR